MLKNIGFIRFLGFQGGGLHKVPEGSRRLQAGSRKAPVKLPLRTTFESYKSTLQVGSGVGQAGPTNAAVRITFASCKINFKS